MKEIRKNNKLVISLRDKTLINGVIYDYTDDRILVLIDKNDIDLAKKIQELDDIALRIETHLGNKLMLSSVISHLDKYNCILIENNPEVVVAQKRQAVRVAVDFHFFVVKGTKYLDCVSNNISAGGMSFTSKTKFELDEELTIEFPVNIFGKSITTHARVLKITNINYAVKFLDLSQNDEDKIVKYIFKMMVKK